MAQYGSMTLREREDKRKLRRKIEERNQDSDSRDSLSTARDSTSIKRSRKINLY